MLNLIVSFCTGALITYFWLTRRKPITRSPIYAQLEDELFDLELEYEDHNDMAKLIREMPKALEVYMEEEGVALKKKDVYSFNVNGLFIYSFDLLEDCKATI